MDDLHRGVVDFLPAWMLLTRSGSSPFFTGPWSSLLKGKTSFTLLLFLFIFKHLANAHLATVMKSDILIKVIHIISTSPVRLIGLQQVEHLRG